MKIINIADDIRVKDVSIVVHAAPCLHLVVLPTALLQDNMSCLLLKESAFLVFLSNKRFCFPLSRTCVIRYLSSSIPREWTLWFIVSICETRFHIDDYVSGIYVILPLKWTDKQIIFQKRERSLEQSLRHHIPAQIQHLPSNEFLIFSNVCGFPRVFLGGHNKWELLKEKRMKTGFTIS